MGVEQWNKLFSEINCFEKLNDEPIDWQSNEFCSLCKSTNSEFSTNNQSSTGSSDFSQQNQFSNLPKLSNSSNLPNLSTNYSFNLLINQKTIFPTNRISLNICASSNVDSLLSDLPKNQVKNLSNSAFSLINLSTMTTTPLSIMTNTNNSINDSDHLNSMNTLISNENMANKNESDHQPETKIKSANEAIFDCALREEDYSKLSNNKSCMNSDLIEQDNSSNKSDTLSNGSIIEQSQAMTISDSKPNLNLLSNLLSSDMLTSTSLPSTSLFEKLISHINPSTNEQPLDLSLSSKKEFDLNELSLLSSINSSINVNSELLTNKIKNVKKHSYTKEELSKALDDIQSGRLGTRRAATLYKIPRSTLRNKIHKMNNVDKKSKPINQLITKLDDGLMMNDLDRNDELKLTNDHSPVSDSLRELLKKNICSKTNQSLNVHASTSENLDSFQSNLELQQLLNNLNDMNNLNNNLISNNLLGLNGLTNNYSDTMNNTNLINNALTFQLLNQPNSNLFNLFNLIPLMKQNLNNNLNNKLDVNENLLNEHNLSESINSVLSGNSDRSNALKTGDQLTNHNNDEDSISTLSDKPRVQLINDLEHPVDEHNTDESNVSLAVLDDQMNNHLDLITRRRQSENLSESINSNKSLNFNTNPLLLNTLNMINNNLNNPLNQLSLAGLTSNLTNLTTLNNHLNSLGNLNNLQLNLQPILEQTKQGQETSGNDIQSSSPNTPSVDIDPNRKRPKRGRYRNYNKQDLDSAVKAVQRGEMSVHRAGTLFSIPHSTLEYKVKERHLLRPSKRLKKQQEAAAAQVANGLQQQASTSNKIEPQNSRSCLTENDTSPAEKLKNLLVGNQEQDLTKYNSIEDMPSLLKQTLFQSTSNSISSNLQQQSNLNTSNLLKKLQEQKDSNNF